MQMMIGRRMREHKCHALDQFPTIIIAKVRSTSLLSSPYTHMTISGSFHMCQMRAEFASTSLTELLNYVRSRRSNGMNSDQGNSKQPRQPFYTGKLLKTEKPSGKIVETTTEQVPISTNPAETASRLFSNFRFLGLQKTKYTC